VLAQHCHHGKQRSARRRRSLPELPRRPRKRPGQGGMGRAACSFFRRRQRPKFAAWAAAAAGLQGL